MDDSLEQLERENALLRTIIDELGEGIYAIDENEIVILFNSAMEREENLDRRDVIGRKETDVYNDLDGGSFNRTFAKKILKTKKAITESYFGWDMPGGKRMDSIINMYPFLYKGELAGIYMIGLSLDYLNKQIDNFREQQNKVLSYAPGHRYKHGLRYSLDDIITQNSDMKEAINLARKFATYDSPVMIIGATGTGKELFAQGIHCAGVNPKGPFVPVNCAAIPESLLESILFGTVKGAFTGAMDMPGLFEQAENGTLFLDEINSMPVSLQAKLLRVIQEKKVRRVGSREERDTNCRIVSASSLDPFIVRDAQNSLRSDLFFRLAVITIKLPPLKERPGDIVILANHFIERFNTKHNTFIQGLAPETKENLEKYSWPGNVRELESIIESAMNFVSNNDDTLQMIHIPSYYRERLQQPRSSRSSINISIGNGLTLREKLKNTERHLILEALENNNWNITRAAKDLGIRRQNLHHKIKEFNLSKPVE
jgi:arginine utilization regulatory protein